MHNSTWKTLFFSILIALLVLSGSNFIGETLFSLGSLDEPVLVRETIADDKKSKAKEGQLAANNENLYSDKAATSGVDTKVVSLEPHAMTGKVISMLRSASASKGAKLFRKCKSCHTTKKGGKNTVGPNLWDVVGRAKTAVAGFKYSNVLKEKGGKWSFSELDAFLADPNGFANGTKMRFRGITKHEDRANLLIYLRSLSDEPKPLSQ